VGGIDGGVAVDECRTRIVIALALLSAVEPISSGRVAPARCLSTFPATCPDRKDQMSSPAPQVPNGDPRRNGNSNERASPGADAQTATDDTLRKSRSALFSIGAVLLVVLLVGGAGALLAITRGEVVPSTAALVVVISSVAVVLVALISASIVVRKAFVAAGDAMARAEADGRGGGRDPEPSAAQPSDEAAGSAAPDAQGGPQQRGAEQNPEVFSRIASRLQAKVSRAFVDLDALERRIEDPELLATVFRLDHLVTRIRREVENLSVLGGDAPPARSSEPAEVNQVLRLAVASTEDYQRIMTFPLRGVKIHGHVVAELINLLAELLDNATAFTPPQAPKIALTASRVASGLAIEVHDRGIGMPPEDIDRVNRLLAGYADVDLHQLLDEGRIGFAVVNKLAPRHSIRVQLRTNIFGGIDAAVVIPRNLLIEPEELYGVPHGPAMRLETGRSRVPSPVPARPHIQPMPQPTERPWPPPTDPADGSIERPLDRRHGRAAGITLAGNPPSPFPRTSPRGSDDAQADVRPVRPVPDNVQAPAVIGPPAERPPLPQRGSDTYLRPELRERPQTARVSPGHNPDLLVEVLRGREDAEHENSSDGGTDG
jgi:signal transduction histidine kinase